LLVALVGGGDRGRRGGRVTHPTVVALDRLPEWAGAFPNEDRIDEVSPLLTGMISAQPPVALS
jgi:hypothetical protein